MANRGYADIKTFRGGVKEWKNEGFPIETINALPEIPVKAIDKQTFKRNFADYTILDIRPRRLYGMGTYSKYLKEEIEALSMEHRRKYLWKIPLTDLSRQLQKLPKDKPVVVIDHLGRQSNLAAWYLITNRFQDVFVLDKGLESFTE